jgi:hypothetical protein
VPSEPPEGAVGCDFARDAPTRVEIQDRTEVPIAALQPLTVTFDRARIRELLEPYESDIARVRWLAVLDPSRLRPNTFLFWISTRPCDPGFASSRTFAGISAQDVQSWLAPTAVPQQN